MPKLKKNISAWMVYIIECADGTLYTGITTQLERRIGEHANGTGAKYTKGRGPFKLFYSEAHKNRSAASRRELQIKAMKRETKLRLKQAETGAKQ